LSDLYFKQLLSGVDFATPDLRARSMGNFTYIIASLQTREAFLVDPAWDPSGILQILKAQNLNLKGIIATHHHGDHLGGKVMGMEIPGVAEILQEYPVPIWCHESEVEGVLKTTGLSKTHLNTLQDGSVLKIGAVEIKIHHTPGHSPGGICLEVEDKLLTGDTLFIQGCGRTDLMGGSGPELHKSLTQRLAVLSDDFEVYPGHNYGGTSENLGVIRRTNYAFG
jgi:glyoxylase-like metal-dependent hydrolase (beta-lactamase superfamily II)